ncbi:hypothetical protein N0V90_005246 [Kalmusia sp. IMI 367209]|nr:hypothetical protein N0V90_005246 [Kalmusia sp. IMI 367209]
MESMSMEMTSATSTAGMPMSTGGATSDSMDMAMTMAMTFFTSTTTPLFSSAWTPTSTGQYAGTCIFLIAFAAIFRALLAIRFNFDAVMNSVKHGRGDDQVYLYTDEIKKARRPWKANEAVALGAIDVLVGGVGYLLMIAVMTMNVGYFLSALAGIFVGSLAFSRFMMHSASH